MKLLHTADWHLNDKLYRQDRTDDLRVRVERVAELCEEHAVDVLLVAGDLFSDQARRRPDCALLFTPPGDLRRFLRTRRGDPR